MKTKKHILDSEQGSHMLELTFQFQIFSFSTREKKKKAHLFQIH